MQKFSVFALIPLASLIACDEFQGRNTSDCTPIAEAMQSFVDQPVYSALRYIQDNPALFDQRDIYIHGTEEEDPIERKGGIMIEVNAAEVHESEDLENAEVTEIRCVGFDKEEDT